MGITSKQRGKQMLSGGIDTGSGMVRSVRTRIPHATFLAQIRAADYLYLTPAPAANEILIGRSIVITTKIQTPYTSLGSDMSFYEYGPMLSGSQVSQLFGQTGSKYLVVAPVLWTDQGFASFQGLLSDGPHSVASLTGKAITAYMNASNLAGGSASNLIDFLVEYQVVRIPQ